jgi:transcription elongation factor
MPKCHRGIATITLTVALVSPVAVLAQAPPMDMSWAIRSQQRNWAIGQAAAQSTAMAYYRHMQQLRAMGYTGPSLPTGVTPESLRNSINAANQAGMSYNRAQMYNSQRRSNAVADYDLRAIRGCSYALDAYGRLVCIR